MRHQGIGAHPSKKRACSKIPRIVLLAALALAGSLVLAACGGGDSGSAAASSPDAVAEESDPAAVVAGYFDAVRARDIEGAIAFFSEDVVIDRHPFTAGHVEGTDSITSMMRRESGGDYQLSNIQVSGSTITWDHEWSKGSGPSTCTGTGNEAVVEGSKILSWKFASWEC